MSVLDEVFSSEVKPFYNDTYDFEVPVESIIIVDKVIDNDERDM